MITDGFEINAPTREERLKAERDIYVNVPDPHLCAENERKWYGGATRTFERFTEPIMKAEKWIPIGVNGDLAAAFITEHAKVVRTVATHAEVLEFATFWTSNLFRCRYKKQYKNVFNRFRDEVAKDPTLKDAANWIFRNEKLLAFRDALPETKPVEDKETGLSKTFLDRTRPDHLVNVDATLGKNRPSKVKKLEPHKVIVATCHYKAATSWKQHKELLFYSNSPPAAALYRDKLLVMSEEQEGEVTLQLFDLTHDTKTFLGIVQMCNYNWVATMESETSYAVSDGRCIVWRHDDGSLTTHGLDSQECVISCIKLKGGNLLFGTSTGLVYRVNAQKIQRFGMVHDICRINTIAVAAPYIIAQTVSNANVMEQVDQRSFSHGRLLCCGVSGTRVAMLTKYGIVKVHSLVKRDMYLTFVPPKGINCNITALMPWYNDGIWMSDDGSDMVVLYPNGRVWYLKY